MALLLILLSLCATAADKPWPGRVRVQGTESSGDLLRWDPALSDRSAAWNRELAWDAADGLQTRRGAWYHRVWGLRGLRPPRSIDEDVLEADRLHVEAFFRQRGWRQATVTVRREPGSGEGIEDIYFVVDAGEREGDAPISPDLPQLDPGWTTTPKFSALGRGAFLSVYGGVHSDWLEDAERPKQIELHGELGLRAFTDPASENGFGGNRGPWSDLHVRYDKGVGDSTSLFTSLTNTTNLWPAVADLHPVASVGLHWGRFRHINGDIAIRGGRWFSWPWPGQVTRYEPWFDGEPLEAGQTAFFRAYSFARLDLTLIADSTDRAVLPRRGARVVLTGTPAGLARGHLFMRGEADVRGFVPLGSQ